MASGSPSSCVAGFASLRHVALVGHSRAGAAAGGAPPFSAFRAQGVGAAARVEPLQLALDAAARAALDRGVEALDCGGGGGAAGGATGDAAATRLLVLAAPRGAPFSSSSAAAAVVMELLPTADGGASLSTLALLARGGGGGGRAAAATAVALDALQPRAALGDAAGRVAVHDLTRAGGAATEAWASTLAGGAGPSVASLGFWRTSPDVVFAAGGLGGLAFFRGVGGGAAAAAASAAAAAVAAYDTREGRSRPVLLCAHPPGGGGGAGGAAVALSSVSCAAAHNDDPFCVIGGSDSGDVVLWDVRKAAAAQRVASLHSGPVSGLALSAAGDAFSCGEDGDVRALRCAALGPRREARFRGGGAWLAAGGERGGPRAPHVLAGAGRLRGVAWLQSAEQRAADDRGEGLVVVACESGGIEWRLVAAGAGNGEGEGDEDGEGEDRGGGEGDEDYGAVGEDEEASGY